MKKLCWSGQVCYNKPTWLPGKERGSGTWGKESEALGWLCSVVLRNQAPAKLPASFLMPAELKESVDPREGGSSHQAALA